MTDPIASLILTRPIAGSRAFLARLDREVLRRVEVIVSPLLEIVATGKAPELSRFSGVIFTSARGVEFAGEGEGLPAYCVGRATTQAATEAGWDAQFLGENADALVQNLCKIPPTSPLLHISGVHKRGDIAARLTAAGIRAEACEVYDQLLLPLTENAKQALAREKPVIVPLFSPRTARQFADQAKGCTAPLHLIGLSDAVMAEVAGLSEASLETAPKPDIGEMTSCLMNLLRWVEASGAPQ